MLVIKLRAGAAFPVRVCHLSCSLTLVFCSTAGVPSPFFFLFSDGSWPAHYKFIVVFRTFRSLDMPSLDHLFLWLNKNITTVSKLVEHWPVSVSHPEPNEECSS